MIVEIKQNMSCWHHMVYLVIVNITKITQFRCLCLFREHITNDSNTGRWNISCHWNKFFLAVNSISRCRNLFTDHNHDVSETNLWQKYFYTYRIYGDQYTVMNEPCKWNKNKWFKYSLPLWCLHESRVHETNTTFQSSPSKRLLSKINRHHYDAHSICFMMRF